uniref:Uncharacterized protein n=1 Tax=Romanomermis culicivorax TaxID=13658 RepID=A0A915HN19_ROMCU
MMKNSKAKKIEQQKKRKNEKVLELNASSNGHYCSAHYHLSNARTQKIQKVQNGFKILNQNNI